METGYLAMILHEKEGWNYMQNMDISYEKLWTAACATPSQIAYLVGTIKDHTFENGDKVKRVFEIGVANGMSSLYMLKAGADTDDFILYGVDILTSAGKDVYENASDLEMSKWRMHKQKTSFDIEEILNGEKLDMVFIDGMHAHPAALIDFIMVYPQLREDAIVIFHDVETYLDPSELGACYFYTAWSGEKRQNLNVPCLMENHEEVTEYMGMIDIKRVAKDIFADLLLIANQPITGAYYSFGRKGDPLGLELSDFDVTMRNYMLKYYPKDFTEELLSILIANFKDYKSKWIYYKHQNRLMAPTRFAAISPFTFVGKNKSIELFKENKCAIWGAGAQGSKLVQELIQISCKDNLVAWVDSKVNSGLVQKPSALADIEFDYIVIAVESKKAYEEIKNSILDMGIGMEKIVWLFEG